MSTTNRVARNTLLISSEIIITNLLAFGFVIYVTRFLGVMEFGKYAFAKSFLEILVVWSDLGLSQLLIREVARKKEELAAYFFDFLAIKFIYTVFTFGLIALLIHLLGYESKVKMIVYILAGANLIFSFSGAIGSVFQGYERMEFKSSLSVGRTILQIFLGVILLNGYGVIGLCYAILVTNIIHFLFSLYLLQKRFLRISFHVHFSTWWSLIREGFSFGIGSVFIRIFARIDSVMLSKMINMTVVGLYNAAYNIVIVLIFLPGALSQALFPVTSKYFTTDPQKMRSIFERSFKYSILIGFPMALGISLLADRIILLLYGSSFSEAAIALRILIWTLALSFATAMLGNLLSSTNNQIRSTYNIIICAVVNIGLNLILIPQYGFIGASIATVSTEVVLVTLSYIAVCKYVYIPKIIQPIFKGVFGCLVMGIVVYFVRDFSFLISIPLGILTYALMLLSVKTFDHEDWNILLKIIPVKIFKTKQQE